MQLLSSSITPFTKFVLPGVFIAVCPVFVVGWLHGSIAPAGAVIWPAICAFLLWWTAPIKRVSLSGDRFLISNYRREICVPVAHLVRVHQDRVNRTPNITLYFDPPTEFGAKVRIVPPVQPFSRREYDAIAQLLTRLARNQSA